jgi:hypothetical protein
MWLGVAKHLRRIYKVWKKADAYPTVFEVTSLSTKKKHRTKKQRCVLGVWVFPFRSEADI